MRKFFSFCLTMSILTLFALNCKTKIPVRIDDYSTNMGGSNAVVTIHRYPVTVENNTITGIQKEGTTTAVIFKDEKNKLVTNYSNANNITMYHIEEFDKKENFKYLKIHRQFYAYSQKMFIFKILLTPFTLGQIWAMPHELYFNSLETYNDGFLMRPGHFRDHDFFQPTNGLEPAIMITIVNHGNLPITEEFSVVEVLPNFLEFESVEYDSDGELQEVAYDLHKNENSQVIPFKIRPTSRGLKPWEYVKLKINFKPNIQKFKIDKYNPNIEQKVIPITEPKPTVETNTDSPKDSKSVDVEDKSDSTTKPKEAERKSKIDSNKENTSPEDEDSGKKTKPAKAKGKKKK